MLPEQQLNTALAGRYDVEGEIGAGGMATVYLARDVRHSRKVALKVLKPELGAVLGVERFLAEIQVTANLQHPNLLPLFDSGEANGLLFYVMPFVEGETLRHRLDREKQLPIDEAVRISTAIASALDYAHQRGVIHRDLKPENILLQSGQPVIADFGIALAVSNAGGARITQTGLSLGTPQYMSPEQATGDRVIDGRTDIYSLGAMTYEMLVGDPPHLGSTAQAVIAKVLTERPPSARVARPSVSDGVAWAVEHALEKLPADRWSTAREFADALQGKTSTVGARTVGTVLAAPSPSTARWRMFAGATSAATVLATAAAAYFALRSPAAAPLVTGKFNVGLPDSVALFTGAGTKLALSPDGTHLAIVAVKGSVARAIYLRRLNDPVAEVVRGSDSATSPSFSPDGRWLVFKTTTAVKKVPVTGGVPQTLSDSANSSASWGDDGRLVYDRGNTLWMGTSEGRDAKRIAGPDSARHFYRYRWVEVLPGATHALVTIDKSPVGNLVDSLRLGIVSLSDGSVNDLGLAGTNAHYVAPGRIVFGRAGGLVFTAPFSLSDRRVTGPAELVAEGVWQGSGGATGYAVARDGPVLALHGGARGARSLVIVNRSGAERPVPVDVASFTFPRVSPDGRRVAVEIGDAGSEVVWVVDLATGTRTRITPESTSVRPEWTRDGSRIVFMRRGGGAVFARLWDRNAADEPLWPQPTFEVSVEPKGGYWAFRRGTGANYDILVAPAESLDAMRPIAATPASEAMPRVSPNGHLLAYSSNESGREEVYIQPLPGPGPRVSVSIGGGNEPIWSSDGTTLFYRGPTRMMSATISERPTVMVVKRDSMFVDPYARSISHANYDVLPNGQFLMVRGSGEANDIGIVMNWLQPSRGKRAGTGER